MTINPVLLSTRKKIDEQYMQFSGVFGEIIVEDEFAKWLENSKGKMSKFNRYITALAQTLDSHDQQKQFTKLANKALISA